MAKNDLTMIYDSALCVGCDACTTICTQTYELTPNTFRTEIVEKEIEGPEDRKRKVFYKNACLHCKEASCTMACPTGACYKNEEGLVVIDESLCIGCNYCAKNCPFNAISYDKSSGVVEKCTLCADRYSEGLEPLCSTACPTKAIKFASRQKILEYAQSRVEALQKEGHTNACIYGDCEFGGKRVMAVLEDNPEAYGLPADPDIPVALRVFEKMPMRPVSLLAAGLVLGFNFVHSRKYEKKAEEVREKHNKAPFCYDDPGLDENDDLEVIDEKREKK